MKKVIAVFLVVVLCCGICLGLCACGGNNTIADETQSSECTHKWERESGSVVCKKCDIKAAVTKIRAEYKGNGDPRYLLKSDFDVFATYEDGSEKELGNFEYTVNGEENRKSGGTYTYVIEHKESKCTTEVSVTFAEMRYFGESRETFSEAFFANIKAQGITGLEMDYVYEKETGIISRASFRDYRGRYYFFLDFDDILTKATEEPFHYIKIEGNTPSGYNRQDLEKMRRVLISMILSLTSSEFTVDEVRRELNSTYQWKDSKAGVIYLGIDEGVAMSMEQGYRTAN